MAMTMSGAYVLPADKAAVWAKLNDPVVLKDCIPGCESLEKDGDSRFKAVANIKVGPVSARFKGAVDLTDIKPPDSYRIVGSGDGGVAGFAKGSAAVRLEDAGPEGTRLVYDVDANIGGRLAQLGGRLIDSVAKRMADEFFAKFAAHFEGAKAAPAAASATAPGRPSAPPQAASRRGLLMAVVAAAIVAAIIAYYQLGATRH